MKRDAPLRVGSGVSRRCFAKRYVDPLSEDGLKALSAEIRKRNRELFQPWSGQHKVIQGARDRLRELEGSVPIITDNLDGWLAEYQERESEFWYLWQVDVCALVAELAVDQGRPWEAVEQGMLIGEYLTELRTKKLWDEKVSLAERVMASSEAGAKRRRKVDAKTRCDRVREIQMRTGSKLSLRRIFELVALEEGSKPETIKKDWYSQKKIVG